jgi:hypothetical protein
MGFILFASVAFGQEIYQWVDEKGTVHFADDLTLVPPRYQDQIKTKSFKNEQPPAPAVAPSSTRKPMPPTVPRPVSKDGKPVPAVSERKDILGRGEGWWRDQVKQWNEKLSLAQKNAEEAQAAVKAKEEQIEQSRFKPDSLKRKLKAELKSLQDKASEWKKQEQDARTMLDKGLPKQAEEYRADPDWLN